MVSSFCKGCCNYTIVDGEEYCWDHDDILIKDVKVCPNDGTTEEDYLNGVVNITKEKFKRYLWVQHIGAYNMLSDDARRLATLTEEEHFEIISNYQKYVDMYGNSYKED